MSAEWFRNRVTGLVWAADPGSPVHKHMSTSAEFERVEPERPKRRKRGPSEDSTQAAAEADGDG